MTNDTSQLTEADIATQRRTECIANLRALADFLEAHPTLPVGYASVQLDVFVDSKDDLTPLARTVGVSWQKKAMGDWFCLRKSFGGSDLHDAATYDVNVSRETVCRKVTTGTRLVPAQAAVPEHEVEDFKWVCDEPLLKGVE